MCTYVCLRVVKYRVMDNEEDAGSALARYQLFGVQETGWKAARSFAQAAIVELKYLGLPCTAKEIRAANLEESDRLEQECKQLSKLGHPNIVQFMGIYYREGRANIVSEQLPFLLSDCLDHYGQLPEEIGYSILHEVALGLLYLHKQSPPVVHRNLSADCVLLTRDMVAKIADVDVAWMNDPIVSDDPVAVCHLPPETLGEAPQFGPKTDSFSYGVLMVHVLSGRRPIQAKLKASCDSCDSIRSLQRSLSFSEADLRVEFLREIGMNNPLMGLVMSCLSNNLTLRPEASEIVYKVADTASRFPASFVNKVEMLEQICNDAEKKTNLKRQLEDLTASDSCPRRSLTELEQLHLKLKRLTAENIALKANLHANLKVEGVRRQSEGENGLKTNGHFRRPGLKKVEAMPEECDSLDVMTAVQVRASLVRR